MRFLSLLLALSLVAPVVADDDTVLTVEGVKISKDEYIKLLERTTVTLPGGQQAKAERLALDQIVSNIIILREAKKLGLLPSDRAVEHLYSAQKKLMEAQQPGKSYENELAIQGMTPEELKADLKVQMAETNLYASKLLLDDNDVKALYEQTKSDFQLPARTQVRLILLESNTPSVKKVVAQLEAGKRFEDIAKTINDPELREAGGERLLYNTQIPSEVLAKIKGTKVGETVGPVKWSVPQQSAQRNKRPIVLTAWIKVIQKLQPFSLTYADVAPILFRDMIRERIMMPANIGKRDEILKMKMRVRLESNDPNKGVVWEDIKKAASEMGIKG